MIIYSDKIGPIGLRIIPNRALLLNKVKALSIENLYKLTELHFSSYRIIARYEWLSY